MAAYASLLSLGHILDQLLQHPPRQIAVLDKVQIDSLLENITFLQDFLEDFPLLKGDEIQALEAKIARSSSAAKDIIEKRVVYQILESTEAGSESTSNLSCQDLRKVIEEFDSMKKDVLKIKETKGMKIMEQPRKAATAGSFMRGASDSKNITVGFREDLIQIMERLTEDESNLQIHSIVGMGGIGKTTLAKNVFDNPLIVHHFDLRAWVTISQQYSVHRILLGLLKDIGVLAREGEGITQKTEDELGLFLHRSLFDRRYFIVMDDMWSIQVWDGIKRFFPDNNNGSRVMVTTRLSNVADNFRSCTPHQLHFLDEDQSWALFCDKVFGKERCPPELQFPAKKIVRNCRGLPLAIVAISGLLAKSSRLDHYWEYLAKDTSAELNMGGDGLCFEILSLSYKNLPLHLKPCFLYMAIFPEDHKIRISRLVKLWVAEGILKPKRSRSLEEVAEDNLKDLIDRNLIMIDKYGSSNKIRSCTIHDLLRDLCLREAEKENFHGVTMIHNFNNHRRVVNNIRQLISRRSSYEEEFELKSTCAKLHRLLRVLSMDDICSYEEIVRFVNSRYIELDTETFSNLLNTLEPLSVLCNLQTITVSGDRLSEFPLNLPAEIWEMPQLRHLKREDGDFYLPGPPTTNDENGRRDVIVLKNLQTIRKIRNFRCTDVVVRRIPNLKKLGIIYGEFPRGFGWDYSYPYNLDSSEALLLESEVNVPNIKKVGITNYKGFPSGFRWDNYEVYNLAHLRNLESLLFESDVNVPPSNLCFPGSLKKLTLRNCGVCWEDLTVVGSLPHLEVLNLMDHSVKGREWNPVEGQFLELKSLRIEFTDLVDWIADSSHFPRLEKLQLRFLRNLKEIPYGIGEIPTLRSISSVDCNDSVISSAKKIQEEQQNLGNYNLQVVDSESQKFWGSQEDLSTSSSRMKIFRPVGWTWTWT